MREGWPFSEGDVKFLDTTNASTIANTKELSRSTIDLGAQIFINQTILTSQCIAMALIESNGTVPDK